MRYLIALLILMACPVLANFNISPLTVSLGVKEKSASFTLENLSSERAAYEIVATTRRIAIDGEEQREATKLLRAFPSKIILESGQKKRIKVVYLGKRNLTSEQAFRVLFQSLDIDVSKQQEQSVKTKYNFATALYVTPDEAKAKLISTLVEQGQGYILQLKNAGNKHIVLTDWKLELSSQQGSTQYEGTLPDINVLADSEVHIPLNRVQGRYDQAQVLLQ